MEAISLILSGILVYAVASLFGVIADKINIFYLNTKMQRPHSYDSPEENEASKTTQDLTNAKNLVKINGVELGFDLKHLPMMVEEHKEKIGNKMVTELDLFLSEVLSVVNKSINSYLKDENALEHGIMTMDLNYDCHFHPDWYMSKANKKLSKSEYYFAEIYMNHVATNIPKQKGVMHNFTICLDLENLKPTDDC